MSEIDINYKGSTIASMDASGTKTLLTSGKYCEGNVEIVYTRPTGGVHGSIYVPASLVDTYKTTAVWSLFSARITSYTG